MSCHWYLHSCDVASHVNDIISSVCESCAVKCCQVLSRAVMCCHVCVNHMPTPVTCSMCVTILCHDMSFNHMLSCACHEHAVESVETTHLHPASSSRPPFACAFASVCVVAEVRAASRVWCHVMYMTVPSHVRAHHAHLYMAQGAAVHGSMQHAAHAVSPDKAT